MASRETDWTACRLLRGLLLAGRGAALDDAWHKVEAHFKQDPVRVQEGRAHGIFLARYRDREALCKLMTQTAWSPSRAPKATSLSPPAGGQRLGGWPGAVVQKEFKHPIGVAGERILIVVLDTYHRKIETAYPANDFVKL